MAARFEQTRLRRLGNSLIGPLARLGLAGRRTHVLTVLGRKTGRPRSTPVQLIFLDGQRWLVAPYGEGDWVKNARAAGAVELTRARRTERVLVDEVGPEEAAPVLREYLRHTPIVKPYFDATADSPLRRSRPRRRATLSSGSAPVDSLGLRRQPSGVLVRVTMAHLDLSRAQVLAHRRRAGALDERLPPGRSSLERALGPACRTACRAPHCTRCKPAWRGSSRRPGRTRRSSRCGARGSARTVPRPEIDPRDARLELARRYLHVFGPTRPAAFAKWAGIGTADGRAACRSRGGDAS